MLQRLVLIFRTIVRLASGRFLQLGVHGVRFMEVVTQAEMKR